MIGYVNNITIFNLISTWKKEWESKGSLTISFHGQRTRKALYTPDEDTIFFLFVLLFVAKSMTWVKPFLKCTSFNLLSGFNLFFLREFHEMNSFCTGIQYTFFACWDWMKNRWSEKRNVVGTLHFLEKCARKYFIEVACFIFQFISWFRNASAWVHCFSSPAVTWRRFCRNFRLQLLCLHSESRASNGNPKEGDRMPFAHSTCVLSAMLQETCGTSHCRPILETFFLCKLHYFLVTVSIHIVFHHLGLFL